MGVVRREKREKKYLIWEREREKEREERKEECKKIKTNYSVQLVEGYYSSMINYFKFRTSNGACFLVFGVLNAKYVAFSTSNASAQLYVYPFV